MGALLSEYRLGSQEMRRRINPTTRTDYFFVDSSGSDASDGMKELSKHWPNSIQTKSSDENP